MNKNRFSISNIISKFNINIPFKTKNGIELHDDEIFENIPYLSLYISITNEMELIELKFPISNYNNLMNRKKKNSIIDQNNILENKIEENNINDNIIEKKLKKKEKQLKKLSIKNMKKIDVPKINLNNIKLLIENKYQQIDFTNYLDENEELPPVYAGDIILTDYENEFIPKYCFEINNFSDEIYDNIYEDIFQGIPLIFIQEDELIQYDEEKQQKDDDEKEQKIKDDFNEKEKEKKEKKEKEEKEEKEEFFLEYKNNKKEEKLINIKIKQYLRINEYGSFISLSKRNLYYLFTLPIYKYNNNEPPWYQNHKYNNMKYSQKKKDDSFNLLYILTQLKLEKWYPLLEEHNLIEKGVFMHIKKEELNGYGLWIPLNICDILLTISNEIKYIEEKKRLGKQNEETRLKKIQRLNQEVINNLKEDKKQDQLKNEINNNFYNNIKKKKKLNKILNNKTKILIYKIINKIEYNYESIPYIINKLKLIINYNKMKENLNELNEYSRKEQIENYQNKYCCQYHFNHIINHHRHIINSHSKEALAQTSLQFIKADQWKNGFISKEQIYNIALSSLLKGLYKFEIDQRNEQILYLKNIKLWAKELSEICSNESKENSFMANLLLKNVSQQVQKIQIHEKGLII